MITISTGGIGMTEVASPQRSASKNDDKNAVDSFASLMNMTTQSDTQSATRPSEKNNSISGASGTETDKAASKDRYEYSDKEETAESDASSDININGATEGTVADEPETDMAEVNVEDIEKISALIQSITDILKQTLNLSEEELQGQLELAGVDIQSLLDPAAMKDFVLQVKGASEVDLLINEDLSTLIQELTDDISELVEGFDVKDTGELIEKINDIVEQPAETSEETVNTRNEAAEPVNTVAQESTAKAETMANTKQDGQAMKKDDRPVAEEVKANLSAAIDNVLGDEFVDGLSDASGDIQQTEIVRQIIDEIKVNISKEVTSLSVKLNPEQLGNVQITVSAKDGVMQARIIAETEAAKNAIENSLTLLKEAFENQELKVEAIEVMIATSDFFNQANEEQFENESNQSSKNNAGGFASEDGMEGEEELTEAQKLESEMMRLKGNSVSYSV